MSYKCINLFHLVGVFSCFKYIMTLISASRNKLLPLAFTDSWFSFDTSQNLPADSCNMSKELSSLLTSQDFTLFIMASRVHSCPQVQAQPQKKKKKGSFKGEMADDSPREQLSLGMFSNGC